MATEWSFPVDAELPDDPRRALPVFAVPPNWKNGVTETLAWLTDVMSSETAVEQRRSLRRYPRRTFEYEFMRAGTGRSRIENFMAGVGKRDALVPIWHEQFSLRTTPTDDGTIEFPLDTLREREFDIGDLVLITTLDFDRYAILTVIDKAGDTLTVAGVEDTATWPRGSRIVPLRRAKMLDSVTLENVSDRVATTRMRFTLQDADERFSASWGGCAPLLRIKPDRANGLSMEFNRSDYTLDFGTGVVDVTDPGNRSQISQSVGFKFFNRSDVWAYRSFLYSARGRARRFYMPSNTNVLELLEDFPGGNELEAKPTGFSEYFLEPQDARTMLSIDFKGGRPSIYSKVIGVSALLDTSAPFLPVAEQFVLERTLPPILKREIERIGFLVPSRFDQDTVEIFHAVAGSTAVASSVVVRSVGAENMLPLECWTTSRPYPVVAMDEMASDIVIVKASLYVAATASTEEVITGAIVLSGVLQQTFFLETYSAEPEEVITTIVVPSAVLKQLLKTYDMGFDEVQTNGRAISGVLKVALITYNIIPPDQLSTNATIIGATLI